MTHPLSDLRVLDRYKAAPFPPGYPTGYRTFYSPVDDVANVLLYLLESARSSLVVAMFGFDDPKLADVLQRKLLNENVFVQLTLDKTQAGGVHERAILAKENYPAASIAIGSSEHGRIQHMKLAIIDNAVLVTGSTNWSDAAERLQDNQLTVISDARVAGEARARIDAIHANMLTKGQQQ